MTFLVLVLVLVVIILFAGFSLWYLIANDFARETLDVLFPAFGAILLSLYLGFKSVVLDRPPEKSFGTTVAILHDSQHGSVSGMAPGTIEHLPKFGEFQGAELISTLPLDDAYKTIPISELLRDTAVIPGSPADLMIGDIVEGAILSWLAHPRQAPGYAHARTIQLVTTSGHGGDMPPGLQLIQVLDPSARNSLMRARPISISLPPGSKARVATDNSRVIMLETKHSRIRFRIQRRTFELVAGPIGRDAERIHAALRLPAKPQGLEICGFELQVNAEQFPFRRFSRQAKIEAEWFMTLEKQLEADFSWPRLRTIYTSE